MTKVNLLPQGVKKDFSRHITWRRLLLVGASLVIILVFIILIENTLIWQLNYLQSSVEKSQNELFNESRTLKKEIRELNQNLSQEINQNLASIEKARQENLPAFSILQKLIEIMPDKTNLTGLQAQKIKETKKIQGQKKEFEYIKVGIRGFAPLRKHVLTIRDRLKKDPLLKQINSPLENLVKPKNIDFYFSFRL